MHKTVVTFTVAKEAIATAKVTFSKKDRPDSEDFPNLGRKRVAPTPHQQKHQCKGKAFGWTENATSGNQRSFEPGDMEIKHGC